MVEDDEKRFLVTVIKVIISILNIFLFYFYLLGITWFM
jgi:hypothetical protein